MILKELLMKNQSKILAEAYKEKVESWNDELYGWFDRLRDIEPTKSDMTIHLYEVKEDDCEDWIDVCGSKKDDECSYALDFTCFSEWMGMEIDPVALEMGEVKVLVEIIWEMTFHGYEEEVREEIMDDMKKSIEEIENGTAVTYTSEEVFARLMED